MEHLLGTAVAVYGVVLALSPLLQVWKIIQAKSSDDVSLGYFTILTVGLALWSCYGWEIHNWVVIIPNLLGVVVTALLISVAIKYRGMHDKSISSEALG